MQSTIGCGNSLDGQQLFAVYFRSQVEAGINRLAVYNNRAGTAFTAATALFGPGIAQFLPDKMQQRPMILDRHFYRISVEYKRYFSCHYKILPDFI